MTINAAIINSKKNHDKLLTTDANRYKIVLALKKNEC